MVGKNQVDSYRYIIGYGIRRVNSPSGNHMGLVQPIAEIVDGVLTEITAEGFCKTLKIFVAGHYDSIESNYPNGALFKLKVRVSDKFTEGNFQDGECKYIAVGYDAEDLRPKDLFEILVHPLPDVNNRRLSTGELPRTRYILVRDEDFSYGPFDWRRSDGPDGDEIEIDFLSAPLPNVKLGQYQTYRIPNERLNEVCIRDPIERRVFIQAIQASDAEYFDYASDDEVVRYVAKLAADNGIRSIERAKIDALASSVKKLAKINNKFNDARLQRFASVNAAAGDARDALASSLNDYLQQGAGRELLDEYVKSSEAKFLKVLIEEKEQQLNKEVAGLVAEAEKAKARIVELNQQKQGVAEEIDRLIKEREKTADLSSIHAEKDKEIQRKQGQIKELEERINVLQERYKKYDTVEKLDERISYLGKRVEEEVEKHRRMKESHQDLLREMAETDSALQKKLTGLKPFVEAINGSFGSVDENASMVGGVALSARSHDEALKAKDVVESLVTRLAVAGRRVESNFVANLLISTQQSFLTIFAGLPGVGKTTLARMLVEQQGMPQRLKEVAVSRGWTSQKDLIGYFNPLTNRFQQSGTGLHSFLKAVSEEPNSNELMSYVLLDEANLSPVEHYWSAFMGKTDSEGSKAIQLGSETLHVPEGLRFIATINYDGTTEPLSPRLIDRAPIIVLEASRDVGLIDVDKALKDVFPLSASQMNRLFGLNMGVPELAEPERLLFDQIEAVLVDEAGALGRPIVISPRKKNFIAQFCAKARPLVNMDGDYIAFDLAVKQHVLPLIQGSGARFGDRIKKLLPILRSHEMVDSHRYLERMISRGEADLHSYDFFCW